METVKPRWEANQDINYVQGRIDLVIDEYGNYYTPYTLVTNGGKLTEVTLCHVLYDLSFSWMFIQDDWKEEYKYSHLGEPMVEAINGRIEELIQAKRKIFNLHDFIENGTIVKFVDLTSFKTRSKGK